MPQFLGPDIIAPLVRASSTTITMASTFRGQSTKISVGGQQYLTPVSGITLSTASAGFNGLDTGTIAANSLYYVYAVYNSSGVLGLVATLSSTGPATNAGYVGNVSNGAYQWLGGFYTESTSSISTIVKTSGVQQPTRTILTSGSGTYTPPAGVSWLRIRMVGGGSGGGGATVGGNSTSSTAGGSTTFGTLTCTGAAAAGSVTINNAGLPGTATVGAGFSAVVALSGVPGQSAGGNGWGAAGGASPFGGAGHGSSWNSTAAGTAAGANSGSGGAGGAQSGSNTMGGAGGSSGGYIEAITTTLATTYSYAIGAGGAGGASGGALAGAGGAGGSGVIIIEENY